MSIQERTREYLKLEEDLENQIVEARKISVQARIQEELKRLKEQVSTYVLDVLWCQPIRVIQVISTFMNIDGTTLILSFSSPPFSAGPQK